MVSPIGRRGDGGNNTATKDWGRFWFRPLRIAERQTGVSAHGAGMLSWHHNEPTMTLP